MVVGNVCRHLRSPTCEASSTFFLFFGDRIVLLVRHSSPRTWSPSLQRIAATFSRSCPFYLTFSLCDGSGSWVKGSRIVRDPTEPTCRSWSHRPVHVKH